MKLAKVTCRLKLDINSFINFDINTNAYVLLYVL